MKNWILLILLAGSLPVQAQKITIGGYVRDALNKESLVGASVMHVGSLAGVTSNQYGFFSLRLDAADSIELIISCMGYEPMVKRMPGRNSMQMELLLDSRVSTLGEVRIISTKNDGNVQRARMSVIDVPVNSIKNLPVLLGERDLLKTIQLLPGVQGGQEGTTGFYVRGGNLDQNLVQLDEATVYNPNHLFGLFSTFNINAINHVQLIKGGFPAEYGGRLSSILNITMKEGNKTHYQVEGGIGLLSDNITFQGPIKKNNSSFIVSARQSHINLLLVPISSNSTRYHFYDLNAKMNFEAGKKNRLYISYFRGKDKASYLNPNSLNYSTGFGNSTATLRWNHLFGSRIFSNTSIIYNDYDLALSTSQNNYYSLLYTGIRDFTAKTDFFLSHRANHQIRTGFSYTHHRLSPASFSASIPARGNRLKINKDSIRNLQADELAFYAGDEYEVNNKLGFNYGLRIPLFFTSGKTYAYVEPRLTAKISTGNSSSLKASFTRMNQFLHLIPNSTAGLPTDIWIPSSRKTKPQSSTLYALGYFRNFKNNTWETSAEIYYKTMSRQVLFGEGKQLRVNVDIDSLLVYGGGESYGAEFFVRKNSGRLTGWISYTLSKTTQLFSELNFGKRFPFKYDRRHVLSVAANYQWKKNWKLGAVFQFSTGGAYTVPVGRISTMNSGTIFEGNYYVYESRNNYRMRSYHRLDLSASHKKKGSMFGRDFEREWIFGLYNTYSRQNPFFVYFEIDALTSKPTAKQVSLLPLIPGVSFNFKF